MNTRCVGTSNEHEAHRPVDTPTHKRAYFELVSARLSPRLFVGGCSGQQAGGGRAERERARRLVMRGQAEQRRSAGARTRVKARHQAVLGGGHKLRGRMRRPRQRLAVRAELPSWNVAVRRSQVCLLGEHLLRHIVKLLAVPT